MNTDKKLDEESQKSSVAPSTEGNSLKEKYAVEKVVEAHEQADADIANDPDLSMRTPNDDLDEGEIARLGDDNIPVL